MREPRVEHRQQAYDVRCEWGAHGVVLLARECAVVVIVDVLSFCTAVDVAVNRGARVLPQRWTDADAYPDSPAARATAAAQDGGRTRAHHTPDGRARERPRSGPRPRTGRPRTGRPRTGRPRTGRPRTGRPRSGRARTAAHGTAAHGTAAHGTAAHGAAAQTAAAQGPTTHGAAAQSAAAHGTAADGTVQAGRRDGPGPSLRPSSLLGLAPGTLLALPSPNGASLCAAAARHDAVVMAGCLRNATAVAVDAVARAAGGPIGVVPAGERWPDDTLRVAAEDALGAGAVVAGLTGRLSPEAELVAAQFAVAGGRLPAVLAGLASGRELIADGYEVDVQLAAAYDVSTAAPRLVEGALTG